LKTIPPGGTAISISRPKRNRFSRFIERTINAELVEELAFLANYDRSKNAIQDIVDMPDRQIDLFIRSCLQNSGRLSARKRTSHFDFLSDEEVVRMEQVIQSTYGDDAGGQYMRLRNFFALYQPPATTWRMYDNSRPRA